MDGLLDAAKELFGYNRESFMFDSELRMKREYQEQNLRVRQFMLYREDVRDLTELTTGKMDSYLLVALLELGCCFDLLVHGVLELNGHGAEARVDQPDWLLWLYVVSLSEAFVYLFLSAWFAIHASVAAHSFAVRLLTQFVRLPVPDKSKLDAARAYAAEFEGSGAGQMLRVPMLGQLAASAAGSQDSETSQEQAQPLGSGICAALASMNMDSANSVAMLKHVRLYRNLQSNWQAHDAYARACLALGTYTLTQAVAYYTIGYFVVELHSVWPALGASIILPGLAWLLIRLDLYFSSYAMVCWATFLMLGPFLAWIATVLDVLPPLWAERFRGVDYVLVPVNFFMHVALIASIVLAASADHSDDVSLPTRFRTVLYLDVFGWITDPEARQLQERATREAREGNRGQQLPPQLVESLKGECRLLITALHLEFQAWESHAVAESVRATPGLPAALQECKEAFTQLKRLLALDPPPPQEEPMPNLWLRLVPEEAVECYMSPETGEARREPPEGAKVCDLTSLRQHLVALSQRCQLLHSSGHTVQTSAFQSVDSAARLGLPQMGSTSSASTLLRPQPLDTSSLFAVPEVAGAASTASDVGFRNQNFASLQGASTVGLQHMETWPLPGQANMMSTASAGSVGPHAASMPVGGPERRGAGRQRQRSAQETRFGGSEAAQVEALANGYSHSPGSAQTFHPRQDGRRESRRPPGQVPWITFLGASVLVGSVWVVGVAQYVIEPLIDKVRHDHEQPHHVATSTNARLLHAANAWPGRPVDLRPTGLACGSSHGSAAFLSERYTVYEVPLDGRPPRQSQAAHACLARAPAFHAAGIGGVSLEDSAEDGRALLLRSMDGRRALRCPLHTRRQPTIVRGRMAQDSHSPLESGWDGACRWGERLIAVAGAEVWEVEASVPSVKEQTE